MDEALNSIPKWGEGRELVRGRDGGRERKSEREREGEIALLYHRDQNEDEVSG